MSCAACFTGALHDDVTPLGTETVLFGVPCYVGHPEPADTKAGTVVIISDAFGWRLKNSRALADLYAKKGGFKVLLPDFFNGKSNLVFRSLTALTKSRCSGSNESHGHIRRPSVRWGIHVESVSSPTPSLFLFAATSVVRLQYTKTYWQIPRSCCGLPLRTLPYSSTRSEGRTQLASLLSKLEILRTERSGWGSRFLLGR